MLKSQEKAFDFDAPEGFVASFSEPVLFFEEDMTMECDKLSYQTVEPTMNEIFAAAKDQGVCGSCWAFATVAQIESYTALAGDGLVDLSVEQVTACAPNPLTCGGSGGCLGSVEQLGYNYVQLFGATSDKSYPYVSGTGLVVSTCEIIFIIPPPIPKLQKHNKQ